MKKILPQLCVKSVDEGATRNDNPAEFYNDLLLLISDLPQQLPVVVVKSCHQDKKTATKPIPKIRPQNKLPISKLSFALSSAPRKTSKKSNNNSNPSPSPRQKITSSSLDISKAKPLPILTSSSLSRNNNNKKINANSTMGWGQPLNVAPGAKRGRHCSDENNQNTNTTTNNGGSNTSSSGNLSSSSSSGNNSCNLDGKSSSSLKSGSLTEKDMTMKAASSSHQFGKRPRDLSPLNGSGDHASSSFSCCCDHLDVLPDANRLTINEGDDDDDGEIPSCSAKYSNKKQQQLSSSMILTNKLNPEEKMLNQPSTSSCIPITKAQEKFFNLSDLTKIRTSTPKPLRKGPQKVCRGPRVSAVRPRTAYPRKMTTSPKKSSRSSSSSTTTTTTTSSSSAGGSTTSTSTFISEEEGAYIDCGEEEVDDSEESGVDDDDDDEEEVSVASSRTPSSIDLIPAEAEVSSPEIVPAIRPSYFPNVPPYINFCLHNQRTEPLPWEIQKHLKWRLSNITPVVVKKTLTNSGYRLLRKTVEWNGHWGRHMKAALFKTSIKDFQKLNHLPGTFQIGRKDRLWRNIQRFMNKFGKEEFGFMPKTFVLPMESKQLKQAWDSADSKNQLWIVKPPALARGTGIRVVNRWQQVPKKKPMIVQSYIGNPYLINDRKFDLRIYVLVTNFHPLKVYIYNDGLVRFAPVKYSSDAKRAGDRFMHLTNYSINKNCELYTKNEDADASEGHKWTLKTLWRHFLKEGKDVETLWSQIEEIVIKTLICAEDPIVSSTTCYLPNLYNGYELFGYDIILDAKLKPWLLEVNISPSLHSSSPLDLAVKGPMIKELLNIVGYHLPPKLSPLSKAMLSSSLDVNLELETPVFDKRIYVNNSLSKEEQTKHKFFKTKFEKRTEYLDELIETLTPDDIRQLIVAEDELSQCYNFYRIYPTTSTHTYTPYFELPRYYNMLFDAWENKYHDDRPAAVSRLRQLCHQKIHLQVPVNAGSMISESPVIDNSDEVNGNTEISSTTDDQSTNGNINNATNEKDGEHLTEEETTTLLIPTEIDHHQQTEEKSSNCSSSSPLSSPVPICASSKLSLTPPTPAVLDNITNNCSRSIGSNCPCHPHNTPSTTTTSSSSSSNGGISKTQNNNSSSIPPTPKVTDLPKGICF